MTDHWHGKRIGTLVGLVIVSTCILVPRLWLDASAEREERHISIRARQYAFSPPRITVNKGDVVHLRLASIDVVHGFYLEGYDLDVVIEPGETEVKVRHPSEGKDYSLAEEIVFTADRTGKFRYRCSHTCGTLHPFMQGEMIVRPNYAFWMGSGGAVGVLLAVVTGLAVAKKVGPPHNGGGEASPEPTTPKEGTSS